MKDPELAETLRNMAKTYKPEALDEVGYKGLVSILAIPLERVMDEAITLRRKRIALNRREALEGAYDYLLNLATKGEYERSGEVYIDRDIGKCRAFCWVPDKTLAV